MKIAISLVVALILITSVVSAAAHIDVQGQGTGMQDTGLKDAGQGTSQDQQTGSNETGLGATAAQSHQTGQNQTGQGTGQAQQEPVGQGTQNMSGNMTIQVQQREEVRVQNGSGLHETIEQREREMNREIQALEEQQQQVYQNQNRVRLAVHSLVAAEEFVGDTGHQVSQIAEEINNSVQATIQAEERIQSRNSFVRFFVGGDEAAADEIEQHVIQNQERIRQLQQLVGESDCDEEVRAIMQEQIQNIEQEQTRLQELARTEKSDNGLFGRLWE